MMCDEYNLVPEDNAVPIYIQARSWSSLSAASLMQGGLHLPAPRQVADPSQCTGKTGWTFEPTWKTGRDCT